MKIGILQCDSILPDYRDRFDDYPQMIRDLLQRVDPDIETLVYDVENGEYPDDIDACDAYITTGSKASVYEDREWIRTLQDFIVQLYQQEKKLAAICFGHQLVAQAFGGDTQRSDKGWGVGVHSIDIHTHKPWMDPHRDSIGVLVSHQDQVLLLPEGAELIAGNPFCPHSMFVYDDRILCIQGHPEFSHDYAEAVMRRRREAIGEDRFNSGIESLQSTADSELLARWLVQFLMG
jgi:GMP synthase-like glutamine amidotransferase